MNGSLCLYMAAGVNQSKMRSPVLTIHTVRVEKKKKDYAFRRQVNEKPGVIPGCPGIQRY